MLKHNTIAKGVAIFTILLTSCSMPKKIVYFEDSVPNEIIAVTEASPIVAQPNDELNIIVTSKDPELAAMFNQPIITYSASQASRSYNQFIANYTVDAEGNISFPILGQIHVGGLTRAQIAQKITDELVSKSLINSPTVVVDFLNAYFSVTGEVTHPGRYSMDRDQMSVMDALASAGDLTIFGSRPNVKVLRNEDGKQKIYEIDLTSVEKMVSSPAYYIQQNDVIYVTPNATRGRQSTVNGNNVISYSFWLSLASVLTSMAVLIFK